MLTQAREQAGVQERGLADAGGGKLEQKAHAQDAQQQLLGRRSAPEEARRIHLVERADAGIAAALLASASDTRRAPALARRGRRLPRFFAAARRQRLRR